MPIIRFIKNWSLPIAMLSGIFAYFVYTGIPVLAPTRPYVNRLITFLQPALIFFMLFITFCKINPKELRLCRWHAWLLLVQAGSFALLAMILAFFPNFPGKILVEGAMLCMICPTATAAVVVVGKLGSNAASLVSYTILVNLTAALVIPIFTPIIHPHPDYTFSTSFTLILGQVFPLLFFPFVLAMAVRSYMPRLHKLILQCKDLAFYLWLVALAIAIGLTTKTIVHSQVPINLQIGIALVSLICCFVQFRIGKRIGAYDKDEICAGQALGQKNTVFAIWMSYTFLSPITSIAGGFYSIWHNLYNSYQLYRKRQNESNSPTI